MPERDDDVREVEASIDEAMMLAVTMHRAGRREEAEGIYEQILAHFPDHVDALHFLGVLRHDQDKNEEGVELIRRALVLNPDYTDARSNLGNILRRMGRHDEAEAEYRRVLEARPDHADAWNNLGTVLRLRDDGEGAAAAYRKAIAADPEHADAWQNLGNEERRAGRFEEAAKAYRKALSFRQESPQAHLNLGRMLYRIGMVEEAAGVYRDWLEFEPDNPIPAHMLAGCTGEGVPTRATDDFVRRTFDAFSADFDEVLARLKYAAPRLVKEAVERETLPENPIVLDAGCGTGLLGPLLRPLAKRLVGVDLSPAMLSSARERKVYDELIEGELTGFLKEHPQAYDVISSADVLVYFGDLREVLGAAADSLKPGGRLVFTTERIDAEEAPDGFRLHPHGRYAHAEDYLRSTIEEAGLSPRRFEAVQLRLEGGEPVHGTLAVAAKD